MKKNRKGSLRFDRLKPRSRRRGFTLVQIVVVLAIILILASLTVGVFAKGRKGAQRAQCDTNLKALAIALDAFRQENARYPLTLSELPTRKYLDNADVLTCPSDPRDAGTYADYYIPRAPRNGFVQRDSKNNYKPLPSGRVIKTEPPIVVCPFHEGDGEHGAQAFVGRATKQFSTRPAQLIAAAGSTIERPGEAPIPATTNMELHGGDRIRTAGGMATIRFADGTTCEIKSGSDVTVLQSFVQGSNNASPLYSIVRQVRGSVTYTVNQGSDFDVVTPTATAGAMGTKFEITVDAGGVSSIHLTQGAVYLATLQKSGEAPLGVLYTIVPNLLGLSDPLTLLGL
ncbi:MAG: hypothetical protein JWN98_1960 [Abditibacteriota bacterium]|nr:hypothetical protein [Abditibacteriota bacterium]